MLSSSFKKNLRNWSFFCYLKNGRGVGAAFLNIFRESKKDISRTVSQVCMRSGYATNDPNEKLSQFWRSQKVKNLILFTRVAKRSHEYRKTNKPSRTFQNTKCLKSCTSAWRNQNTKSLQKPNYKNQMQQSLQFELFFRIFSSQTLLSFSFLLFLRLYFFILSCLHNNNS